MYIIYTDKSITTAYGPCQFSSAYIISSFSYYYYYYYIRSVKDDHRKMANRNRKRNVTEKLDRRRWGYRGPVGRFIRGGVLRTARTTESWKQSVVDVVKRSAQIQSVAGTPSYLPVKSSVGFCYIITIAITIIVVVIIVVRRSGRRRRHKRRRTQDATVQSNTKTNNIIIIVIIIKTPCERPGAQVATAAAADIIRNVVFLFLLSAAAE